MTDPDASLLPDGTMLAHYELRGRVGNGAMGTVYQAWDTALDRRVAVKVLKREIAESEKVVQRFQREARAAAKVNHENLTHIYFVGCSDDRHYIAMEFLPGRNLEQYVREEGPRDLDEAVEILLQAARGLGAAHQGGVVHRDVKPSNIQILPGGQVKVTDFGLAKSVSGDIDVTGAGGVVGTPRFMSPEQCRGGDLDRRSDIYSLGLVGWYLLAGCAPYTSKTIGMLFDEQMNLPLPPLAELRPTLPGEVGKVLGRLCAKGRDDRPESMEEAIGLLETLRPRELDLAPIATRGVAAFADIFLSAAALTTILEIARRLINGFPGEDDYGFGVALFSMLFLLAYYVLLEARFGATIGKMLFRLRVVGTDGARAPLRRLLGRFWLRYPIVLLPLVPPGLSVAPTVLSIVQIAAVIVGVGVALLRRRRTLSDLLMRTRVAYVTSPEVREKTATGGPPAPR